MKCLLAILLACCLRVDAQSHLFVWDAPTNGPVDYYVMFYGTHPHDYTGMVIAGHGTNFLLQATLPSGPIYFALTAVIVTNSITVMSDFSNETVLTNTPAIYIESVLLTSTNIDGWWTPFSTNRAVLVTALPQQFFRAGDVRIARTNILIAPPAPN